MRSVFKSTLVTLAVSLLAVAQTTIVITVGGQVVEGNASTTFQPQRVDAAVGDTVIFNFTAGNHSATQSTFAAPCIPAHDANITINGFDSGFRDTDNGTAITILSVPILTENFGAPFWFYDASPGACGEGAVGVINSNENGNETLAGFERNAIRLNGTQTSTVASHTATSTSSTSTSTTATASSSSSAERIQAFSVAPLALLVMAFSFL